jgi:glycosyltransferase involved in cell wall biosynthesis
MLSMTQPWNIAEWVSSKGCDISAEKCGMCSVLVRTFNSEKTLPSTLCSLNRQTCRPSAYVFVDSGSTDATLTLLPAGSYIHHFIGREFNYSEALNQGLKYISTEYVLIISSHTELENCNALQYATDVLNSDKSIGALYFCDESIGPLSHDLINEGNFDGFNGLWNTCAVIRLSLLRERAFRSDVFTAEDQEWARWFFSYRQGSIARVSGGGRRYRNSRGSSLRKRVNEYVSIAYFTKRELLGARNVARFIFKAFALKYPLRCRQRLYSLWLFFRLLECHIRKPTASSRYF